MEFGQKVRSKATGTEGTLTGISGNKVSVAFESGFSIVVPIETLEIEDELLEMIKKEMGSAVSASSKTDRSKSYGSSVKIGPLISKTPNMVFFNIAYMKEYKGITDDDRPFNGGKYVGETGNAGEKFNFLPFDDEYVYGFMEPGFTKGGWKEGAQKELHIENIDPSCRHDDHINNVIVVMCANSPVVNKTVIIGWYDNATVYRDVKLFDFNGQRRWMICKCRIEDAHLIKEADRDFIIPRASKDGTGFGQANFWYANQEKDYDFRMKVLEYLGKS